MAVRKRTVGEGFSRRVELALFDSRAPQDSADTVAAHNAARLWTLDGQLAVIEAAAGNILATPREGASKAERAKAEISDEFAERALRLIEIIRAEALAGNADQVGRWALELGGLVREHDLKIEFEQAALAGAPTLRNLANAREVHNEQLRRESAEEHARWQAHADALWAVKPKRSKSEVARIIQQKFALDATPKYIAARLKKPAEAG